MPIENQPIQQFQPDPFQMQNPFQTQIQDTRNLIFEKLDRFSLISLSKTSMAMNEFVLNYLTDVCCPKIKQLIRKYFPSMQAENEIALAASANGWKYVHHHFQLLDKPRDEKGNSLLHLSVLSFPYIPYKSKVDRSSQDRIVQNLFDQKHLALLNDLLEVHPNLELKNTFELTALDIANERLDNVAKQKLLNTGAKSDYEQPEISEDALLWLQENPATNWVTPPQQNYSESQ